jgi:TolB-like protein
VAAGRAIALVALVVAGCALETDATPMTSARGVVVLPMTGNAEARGRAFSERVALALARTPGVRVMPGTSAPRREHSRAELREVASLLNVGSVLYGTLTVTGHRVHASLRLLGAGNDSLLWTAELDADTSGARGIENRAVEATVRAIRMASGLGDTRATPDTASTPAFRAAAERAEYSRQLAAKGDLGEAVREARRAHELDPLSVDIHRNYVTVLTRAGRAREAREQTARLGRTTRYIGGSQP